MKAGGSGGAKTQTGARFEEATDLVECLKTFPEYSLEERRIKLKGGGYRVPGSYDVHSGTKLVANIARQTHFTGVLLPSLGVEWHEYVSRDAQPDEAVWFPEQRRLLIVEKKSQMTSGSTDEKLASGPFRLQNYARLVAPLKGSVDFWFVLDAYFADPKYRDVLQYAQEHGCRVAFRFTPEYLSTPEGQEAQDRVRRWRCLASTELPLADFGFAGLPQGARRLVPAAPGGTQGMRQTRIDGERIA